MREQPVDDDRIHRQPVQGKIHERTFGFAKHHFLGVGDQPNAGGLGVFHDLVHAFQLAKQIADI